MQLPITPTCRLQTLRVSDRVCCSMTSMLSLLMMGLCCGMCAAQEPQSVPFNTTAGQFPATQANGPASPSCGFGQLNLTSFPFGRVASINANSPLLSGLPQQGCGACFQVTCEAGGQCADNNSPVVVQLVDSGAAALTIRQQEFASLAPPYLGNIPVSAQLVNCTPPGNIVIRVLEYRPSGGGYLKLTFLNAADFLSTVLIGQTKANMFQAMSNTNAAVWVASNLPSPPLDVRLIAASGQVVTAVGAITATSTDTLTNVQFGSTAQTESPPPEEANASPSAVGGSRPPPWGSDSQGGPFAALQQAPSLPMPLPTGNPVPTSSRPPSPLPPLSASPLTSPAPAVTPLPSPEPAPNPASGNESLPTILEGPGNSPGFNSSALQIAAVLRAEAAAQAPAVQLPAASMLSEHSTGPTADASATHIAPVQPSAASWPAAAASPATAAILPDAAFPPAAAPAAAGAAGDMNTSAASYMLTDTGPVFGLKSAAIAPEPCKTIWQLICMSPNLTSLASTIQALGLMESYNSTTAQLTVFAPLNSAFQGSAGKAAPDVTRPVLDYQTVPGGHQLSLLNTLTFLTTAFKVSQVRIIYGGGNTAKVNGVYNAANVVQTDILTCGAGFLQLTDALLVPPNGASGGNHTVMASSATAG